LGDSNVVCVFSEPQFNSGLVDTVIEGTSVKSEELDPLGANIAVGASLYLGVLNGLADQFESCLTK
jgi:zinc transport system substrate-binding protein